LILVTFPSVEVIGGIFGDAVGGPAVLMQVAQVGQVDLVRPCFGASSVRRTGAMADVLTSCQVQAVGLVIVEGQRRIAVGIGDFRWCGAGVVGIGGSDEARVFFRGDSIIWVVGVGDGSRSRG